MSIGAVFFERMLTIGFQSKDDVSGILSKKIASKGVWGNGRFPQLKLTECVGSSETRV